MKTIFDNIVIDYSEFEYFNQLPKRDQIQYLFEMYEIQQSIQNDPGFVPNLKSFFDSVHASLERDTVTKLDDSTIDSDKVELVNVTIDDDNIMIESNSLRAVRHVMNKFIESGYIIQRDVAIEKMFKKDKVTRYIRIFRIIDFITGICLN
jgi:hypothetical protein